jgi:type VI secretion system protein ImpE
MSPQELFRQGQLEEAVKALNVELRENPTDVRRRTFLFELLCFCGEWDRAEKQLHVLAGDNQQAQMGAVLYFSAIHAEKVRHETFEKKDFPSVPAGPSRNGTFNGKSFTAVEDADPRIGGRLELFAAGAYLWIPFEHIESIEMQAPKRLRDTLWSPALVRTGPTFRGTELGEVLIPVLCPFSARRTDANVRLGRATEWAEDGDDVVPFGQKVFLIDDEEVPLLELRKLEFAIPEEENTQESSAVN